MAEPNAPKLPKTVIPWWQDGNTTSDELKEPYFLSKGVFGYLQRLHAWLLFPLNQMDALTCSERTLKLIAWDRDITRFEGEPLGLFRKRVKYAAINAKDAGSVSGFKRIFERLGIGIVAFKERENPEQWDVCTIELSDGDISSNARLAQTLIEQYGRTCRRYRFEVMFNVSVSMGSAALSHSRHVYVAKETHGLNIEFKPQPIQNRHQGFIARL